MCQDVSHSQTLMAHFMYDYLNVSCPGFKQETNTSTFHEFGLIISFWFSPSLAYTFLTRFIMPVVLAGLLIMFILCILRECSSFNGDHSIFSKCTLDHKIASLIQHMLGIELFFNILVLGNVLTGHFGKLHKVET